MTTQVIVLNGGSSSGKSGIARCLQAVLPRPWLAIGVDTLIQVMPVSMQATDTGIEFAGGGGVNIGPDFRLLEAAWMAGVAAMVRVSQAEAVHRGVAYDLEVDTTHAESLVCARDIAARVA